MRVAVLGAGYAGLTLARTLESSLPESADLVVVDEAADHVVQHELHRVIRRPSIAEDISVSLADVLDCEIRQATVTDVDPASGTATLDDGSELDYDVGAICLGAVTDFHDIPGLRGHATPLKRLAHAREIRENYLDVLDSGGRVIIGGAGLSGVQVAGELAAMRAERERRATEAADEDTGPVRLTIDDRDEDGDASEAKSGDAEIGPNDGDTDAHDDTDDDGDIDDHDTEIVLLEQLDSVAPTFPENFQRAVHQQLTDRGVEVRTNATVDAVETDVIDLSTGEAVSYDQLIWTGGIRGPAALRDERPVVRSDLRLAGETFVVGDAGRVVDANGEAAPASAQTAIREARVAAKNIRAVVEHRTEGTGGFEPRLDRYTFDSPGWLVSVGDGAVAQVGGTVLTGRAALALKTTVGAGYLGSVGAIENAVELVQEELGLAIGDERQEDDGYTDDGDDEPVEDG